MPKYIFIALGLCLFSLASCESSTKGGSISTTESAKVADTSSNIFEVADSLRMYLNEISRLRGSFSEFDSIGATNKHLLEYIKHKSITDPGLLNVSFDGMDTIGMKVITSDDSKVRIYCWNTQTGGTMKFFNAVLVYKSNAGANVKVLNDISVLEGDMPNTGALYSDIYMIATKAGDKFYLITLRSIGSSRDMTDGIRALAIEEGKLNDSIKVFMTSRENLNSIEYYYDFFSNIDDHTGEQRNVIRLSDDNRLLYIPVVNDKDSVTARSLVYKFDGYKFVYDKNAR